MSGIVILLTSVGRRPYLVEWFKNAAGKAGTVIAADADPYAASKAFADRFIVCPQVVDSRYDAWLEDVLSQEKVDLAVSINDFELSRWARLPITDAYKPLVRLEPRLQDAVEDKVQMFRLLRENGVPTPSTWVAEDVLSGAISIEPTTRLVTKGRFGSASRGLRFTTGAELRDCVESVASEVTDESGQTVVSLEEAKRLVIVQPMIEGEEFGLDVVSNLEQKHQGVLARRKIKMRGGETDKAITVDSSRFSELGRQISNAVPHAGSIDVDCIVDEYGQAFVIDINPRFGGGYPFCHIAGADVPAAYISWASGGATDSYLDYKTGVVGAKYVEVSAIP